MRRLRTAAALATFLFGTPALAQMGNPGGWAPTTQKSAPGMPAPHQTNAQDQLFAQLAVMGGMAEIAFGNLAGDKAQNRAVKDFARLMVEEHGTAGHELMRLAKLANVPAPDELDAEHQALRSELDAMRGVPFDIAYMRRQVVDHQKNVEIFMWEIASGEDGDLQRFASKTLPTLFAHLRMAQDITAQLTGQTARELPLQTSGLAHEADPPRQESPNATDARPPSPKDTSGGGKRERR